jgi:hypothetical protein
MYASHGHSLWFRMGARFFNIIYTTKTYNLEELKLFGAKDIRLTLDSYCSYVHFSRKLSRNDLEKYKCDVSAIGAYESQRANSLLFLASNGIKICVWGSGWAEWVNKHPNLDVKNQFLFGSEYAKAICASTISINFLRKINRDEITSRSMEIPACGTFMIAERTDRHLQYFYEGVEAEFFNSDEELLKKIQFYLNNNLARSEIAKNGLKRCLSSGYGMHDQYSIIINDIYKSLNTHSK